MGKAVKSILTDTSIVIVAHDVNISIFKPLWLVKTNIFREDELQGNIIVSPVSVNIPTDNFGFVVFPNRIQMSIPHLYPEAQSDINRILGGIVKTLPHTPYTAMGLNCEYLSAPEDEKAFESWNKNLLSSKFSNIVLTSKNSNPRFGGYFSYDFLEARLKIDIKPIVAEPDIKRHSKSWSRGQDLIRINFNLHHDINGSEEKPELAILKALEKWTETLSLSQEIVDLIHD